MPKPPKTDDEPHVGIFWLVNATPLIDSVPISEAEPYGDHLTHSYSHDEVWERIQRIGKAPAGVEYEEFPRG